MVCGQAAAKAALAYRKVPLALRASRVCDSQAGASRPLHIIAVVTLGVGVSPHSTTAGTWDRELATSDLLKNL